jgi:hypothetical protein
MPSDSADEIQQQMRQVRRELREDVEEIVENAQVLTDWRHYVRRYPVVCLGAAAAAGYLLVPARRDFRPDPAAIADALQEQALKLTPPVPRKSLFSSVLGLVGPLVWQAAMTLGKQQLAHYLNGHQAADAGETHPPADPERPRPHVH